MRILLDSHLVPALAAQLRQHDIDAVALSEWLGGNYRSATDRLILAAALSDRRVLVTLDCRTIPPLLRQMAEIGQHHAGVILVHRRTLRPNDVGGLLRALRRLVLESGDENWEDQTAFLRAGQ